MAPGEGPWRQLPGAERLPRSLLLRLYTRTHDRDLERDLEDLPLKWRLQDEYRATYWYPRFVGRAQLKADAAVPANALYGLTAAAVEEGALPDVLAEQGFVVDERVRPTGNINSIMRVTGKGTAGLWVKTEENRHAVQAEVVASYLWSSLNWPGIFDRSVALDGGKVVVLPDLGAGDVADLGTLGSAFRYLPPEDPRTLLTARAFAVRRVTLADLRLHDPDDVLRFLLLNAVLGNSDRHQDNVHYGWQTDPGHPAGGRGYLLPLDHGRCLNNNDISRPGLMRGTPADAVTGRVANPNQLLRAFVERASVEGAEASMEHWLERVGWAAGQALEDPAWEQYKVELRLVEQRAQALKFGLEEFVMECNEVVR